MNVEEIHETLSAMDPDDAREAIPDAIVKAERQKAREAEHGRLRELLKATAEDAERAVEALLEGRDVGEVKSETIHLLKDEVESAPPGPGEGAGLRGGPQDAAGGDGGGPA